MEPLLEKWNREKLHITLYTCVEQFDDYPARLQRKSDNWVNLRGLSDETCITQIVQDEIDILIDLADTLKSTSVFGANSPNSSNISWLLALPVSSR